jgi:hypothetical protein
MQLTMIGGKFDKIPSVSDRRVIDEQNKKNT